MSHNRTHATSRKPGAPSSTASSFPPSAARRFRPSIPATARSSAHLAECDEEDIEQAVRAALAAFPGWKRRTGAARAKLLMKLAQLVEAERRQARRAGVDQRRQADPRLQGDRRGHRHRCAGILRRHGDQDPGRHDPGARPLHQHDAARAARRRRRNHPVELSAAAGGVEDRAGDRGRQHRGAQARRAGLPVGHVSRQAVPGSRHSARRRQHRAGLRRGRRPRAGAAPHGRQGDVHRRDRDRQAHRGRSRRHAQAGRARARRQERRHGVRGCADRPGGADRRDVDLQQPGPGLHRRLAPVPAREGPRQGAGKGDRGRQEGEARRPDGPGHHHGPADLRQAEGARARLHRERQGATPRSSTAARSRRAWRRATSSGPRSSTRCRTR